MKKLLIGISVFACLSAFADTHLLLTEMLDRADSKLQTATIESPDVIQRIAQRKATCLTSHFPITTKYVLNVINRLLESSNIKSREKNEFGFCLSVVLSDDPDSLANRPGGILHFPTSIILTTRKESILAFWIAHELSHHLLHHAPLQAWMEKTVYGSELDFILTRPTKGYPKYDPIAESNYLKARESEADTLAVYLLANAGYDPKSASKAIKNVVSIFENEPEHGSHPKRKDRLANISTAIRNIHKVKPKTNEEMSLSYVRLEVVREHKKYGLRYKF